MVSIQALSLIKSDYDGAPTVYMSKVDFDKVPCILVLSKQFWTTTEITFLKWVSIIDTRQEMFGQVHNNLDSPK